ncbi:MAG: M48 family metallopeptidase, partial [Azoarcus sp.]|nr:M48 family metallopeptidase [Azoarcus sp.]
VSSMAECVFSGALLHMLYMPVPMPVGIRLPPEEAPWLFRLIKGMAHVAAAENIDHVWIVSDMNAAILQRPRLAGCIGRVETHLLIGLPLLHSVSPQQLTAVLAHEFAHLAVQRKGMDKYASMLRAWCLRVLDSVEVVSPLCAALMDRGLRCLYDDMIRLARIEEFEADALATRLVDTRLLGEALIEVSLKANFLIKDFWKRILAQVERRAMPRMRPYRDMSLGVAVGFIRSAMESALIDDTHPHSLHPSLRERLSALHAPPPRGTESATTAAAYYLSPLLRDMERAFDRDWWHAVRSDWWRSYRAARRMRKKRKSRKNMNSTRISSRS